MGLIVSEASAFDMLEALTDAGQRGRFTRQRFGEMAAQVAAGVSLTVRDEAGVMVCVMGLWPEADHAEAWLATGPGFRPHLRRALSCIADALSAVAGAVGPIEVRIYVRSATTSGDWSDRVAGARMAAGLGFERIGEEATRLGPVAVFSRTYPGAVSDGPAR